MDFSEAMRKLRTDEGTMPGEIEIIAGNLLDLTDTSNLIEQRTRSHPEGAQQVRDAAAQLARGLVDIGTFDDCLRPAPGQPEAGGSQSSEHGRHSGHSAT